MNDHSLIAISSWGQLIFFTLYFIFQVLKEAKKVLLWCATPDGVLRAKETLPPEEYAFIESTYDEQQKHDNLLYYLSQKIKAEDSEGLYAQVTIDIVEGMY